MYEGIEIIAEVKTNSPFGFVSEKSWEELFEIANEVGDIISIHTDEGWGGSFGLIKKAKELTTKPILAKGIHDSDELIKKALDAGADLVLVVGRIPENFQSKCLIEPMNLEQLKKIPKGLKVVWNTRDLSNGNNKKERFSQARKLREGWLCQASNIRTVDDIERGANAILVGTNLAEFAKSFSKK